jgi:hypothetical protein
VLEKLLTEPTAYGVVGLLLIAVIALVTNKFIVTAKHHGDVVEELRKQIAELRHERDEFKAMVMRTVETTDRALRVAQEQTKKRGGSPS